MENKLIKVLQSHIEHGERNSCVLCPLANALTDEIGWSVAFEEFAETEQYGTVFFDKAITDKIKHYDLTGEMLPFNFIIKILEFSDPIAEVV